MKTTDSYQVLELQGKQYLVRAGDIIETDRIDLKLNDKIKIDKVLLSVADDKVMIGDPYIKGLTVNATILKHFLGKKVIVAKFKAKTGYRRNNGFRPSLSQVKIDQLN